MPEQRSRKTDVVALVLFALVVFLTVALVTYHPADLPNVQSSSAASATASQFTIVTAKLVNACGRSGVYAAEGLYRLLGWGAYFFVASLALLDFWLLTRRPLNDVALRASGWLMATVGVTSMLALVGPPVTPGPIIGPGGYLGAAGRALLEINFATAGAFILTISLLVGGLLLCTDHLLIRLTAWTVRMPFRLVGSVGRSAGRSGATAADETDDEPARAGETAGEPAVVIRGKRREGAAADDEDQAENSEKEIPVSAAVASSDESKTEESSEAAEEETSKTPRSKRGLGARLASALRIRNLGKNDQQEMLDELDAAADRSDEVFDYQLPSLDLLLAGESVHLEEHEKEVRQKAKMLEKTFASFGFKVKVVEIETGPVIAQYEIELETGLRLSKITSLADDLAIALRVPSVRIVAPIPGKNTVGIEVPNNERQLVRLREVIEETNGRVKKMKIPIYLGKDVAGNPMAVDLASLPHLLIAGRTGTGKSVCLNSIIVSMLMTRSPNDVRMLMIDPKMVELSPYKKLPHLMHPVVTDMRKAEAILAWAVEKMEERYALLARAGVRHISVYNQLGEEELMERLQPDSDEERGAIPRHLPYIVIVADEIADLMMTSAKEVEQHIIRLAQKSRAVGIHLVLATQKPTVDVITGLIKSNLPARICFQVASRTDSRVVLDEMGAEKLLGNGDMLFLFPGTSTMLRGQGTYLSDDEINRVLDCAGATEQQFVTELVQLKPAASGDKKEAENLKNRDELYEQAVDVVIREGRGSVSLLQRALGIGYGRAARLIDYMAEDGIVGQYNGSQAREVVITLEQWAAMSGQAEAEPAAAAPFRGAAATTALSVAGLTKPKRNRILPDADVETSENEDATLNSSAEASLHHLDEATDEEQTPPWKSQAIDHSDEEGDEIDDDQLADEDDDSAVNDVADEDSDDEAENDEQSASTPYRRGRYTA
jgi:DNA segregation ATPase FtsK/SpoIIIE, S-DNA-T family